MPLRCVHALAFLMGLGILPRLTEGDEPVAYQVFQEVGDIMLGGLFPIHSSVSDVGDPSRPEPLTCTNWNREGFVQALAMRFAIEEINNSSIFLPGRRLGYEIYDTCMQPRVMMHNAMLFITKSGTQDISARCNLTAYNTRIWAVIGPGSSEVAMPTVKLLSTFLIPQISYAITSDKFSDKSIFQSFLRTVPSDKGQVRGMIELVAHFHWNWVATLASDDEYGRAAQSQLSNLALQSGICIAHEGLVPTYITAAETAANIRDILRQIDQKNVKVIIVFVSATMSMTLFQEVIQMNMTKVWIASSAWVLSDMVLSLSGIEKIGPVIGFSHRGGIVPGFQEYLAEAFSEMGQRDNTLSSVSSTSSVHSSINEYKDDTMHNFSAAGVSWKRLAQPAYSVYTAVHSAARALHDILNCSTEECREMESNIFPWQLLEAVKKVNFTILNTSFYFDQDSNPNVWYDVVTHSTDMIGFMKIGEYNGQLDVNDSLINWQTPKNQVPLSKCSRSCEPGQMKRVKGYHSCCFDCDDCSEGTYHTPEDDLQCTQCPEGQWSSKRSTQCTQPTFLFLQWSDTSVIILLIFNAALFILIAAVAFLFFRHRHTPVVQASGGNMSFLALFGLSVACCNPFVFVGWPTDTMCRIQQPFLSICFTAVLSTFLLKSLQVALAVDFKTAPRIAFHWLKTKRKWTVLTVIISVEGIFCVWHMCSTTPLSLANKEVNFLSKHLECGIKPFESWALMFGYNTLLALFSFMCSCMSQKPPKQYNLARDITFSMLGYLILWILFIPTYVKVPPEINNLLQFTTTLISTLWIVGCYFLPKCYILLFRSALEMREYFTIYLK
ncbi:taste receptor type 1 member 3-like [Lissotriton helveticus]